MRGTPTQYFQSLTRPLKILGINRQIFSCNLGIAAFIAYSGHFSLFVDVVTVILFVIGHVAGVILTRFDYDICPVLKRHIHYARFYEPLSDISAPPSLVKPSVAFFEGKRGLL